MPGEERTVTAAHEQRLSLHLVQTFPAHEPRKADPHYTIFNQVRRRLKKLGRLTCWINNADCAGAIELHHSQVEFSLTEAVDVDRFRELYPELHVESDEDFLRFVESEGNLLPLCVQHHRGVLGIHTIHYPGWVIQRCLKAGVTAPERAVR